MTKYRIASFSLLFTVTFIFFSGCSKKEDTPELPAESTPSESIPAQISQHQLSPESTSNQQAANAVTFDQTLQAWSSGQQAQAVEMFLKLQWDREDLFAADSIFRISEAEFVKLPKAQREQIQQNAMKRSRDAKELSKFIVQQAKQKGGYETPRNALIACGKRLSNEDQLALVQLVGKAIVGYTEKELPISK